MSGNLHDPINCACFNIRRAARGITQAYDQAMRPAGLAATQFTLLAMLAGSGGEEGIALTVLAGRLGMDRTTLTRNLSVVERRGWAETLPGEDRRERLVWLTPAGRHTYQMALPYWKTAQENVRQRLGEAGLAELLEISRRLDTN